MMIILCVIFYVFPVAEMMSNCCNSSDSKSVAVIHGVTQWQVCLKDAVQLNQLLCLPLVEPQISRQVIYFLVRMNCTSEMLNFLSPPEIGCIREPSLTVWCSK